MKEVYSANSYTVNDFSIPWCAGAPPNFGRSFLSAVDEI